MKDKNSRTHSTNTFIWTLFKSSYSRGITSTNCSNKHRVIQESSHIPPFIGDDGLHAPTPKESECLPHGWVPNSHSIPEYNSPSRFSQCYACSHPWKWHGPRRIKPLVLSHLSDVTGVSSSSQNLIDNSVLNLVFLHRNQTKTNQSPQNEMHVVSDIFLIQYIPW